ncbi:opioid growth factor receptor region [Pelomyxa schiedti]|nr:opioid growth factor receptor region [Pelomyxa schiedti]
MWKSTDGKSKRNNHDDDAAKVTPPTAQPTKKWPCRGSNYLFYKGVKPMKPSGHYIDEVYEWDFERLEYEHTFIQWLFPMFEGNGVNWCASALEKDEAAFMRKDIEIARRVIKSYRLMLRFYGIQLLDEMTGAVARLSDIPTWKDRYENLNWSGHNNLRITRIITSLGQLGFEKYRRPLIEFFTKEIEDNNQLRNCTDSLKHFWKRLLDYDSHWFLSKTKERASDREPSIFFATPAQSTIPPQISECTASCSNTETNTTTITTTASSAAVLTSTQEATQQTPQDTPASSVIDKHPSTSSSDTQTQTPTQPTGTPDVSDETPHETKNSEPMIEEAGTHPKTKPKDSDNGVSDSSDNE